MMEKMIPRQMALKLNMIEKSDGNKVNSVFFYYKDSS